jgi:hypothetical protein
MHPCLPTLLVLLTLAPPRAQETPAAGRFAAAVAAYRAQRFPEAYAGFAALAHEAGAAASTALLHDLALAALRARRAHDAEAAMLQLAARGDPEHLALRDFVRACAAFLRSEQAEAAANLADAEPGAFATAIAECEQAIALWQQAIVQRSAWPAAARNVARAQQKLAALRAQKAAADRQRRANKKLDGEPEQDVAAPEPQSPELPALPQQNLLTAEQLQQLARRLEQKEQEKRSARRQEQLANRQPGERDW